MRAETIPKKSRLSHGASGQKKMHQFQLPISVQKTTASVGLPHTLQIWPGPWCLIEIDIDSCFFSEVFYGLFGTQVKKQSTLLLMTFFFSVSLHLSFSYLIPNGILGRTLAQPAPSVLLSCYHMKYRFDAASWCFTSSA